jgi:hypothetical protein
MWPQAREDYMTTELDADELALHKYQTEHFSKIMPFVLRSMIRYGALAGALLSGIFYLLTYRDYPPFLLTLVVHPPPPLSEFILNYLDRIPISTVVGALYGVGLGIVYTDIMQSTCRKQVSTDYVEPYDLSFPFMIYQIVLPIPITFLIILIALSVLWYVEREHSLLFVGTSYVTVFWVVGQLTRRFLKWYIPPLLPPLE